MAVPDRGPLPPPDFGARALPIETLDAGARVIRIHHRDYAPLHFGKSGGNRFDDPARSYGVCYLAKTVEGAFAETCLRALGARFVALSFLQARCFCVIETTELRLVGLHGSGLAALGATSAVTSGPHEVAQLWSRAIHDHATAVDGIVYRSNHDNGEMCVVLFERAAAKMKLIASEPIMGDRQRLAALLARYAVGLG